MDEDGNVIPPMSWFPNGTTNLTYTFNGDASAFTLESADVFANLPWAGGSVNVNASGETETSNELSPAITRSNAKRVSFTGFEPSDWAQRIARQLEGQGEGAEAELPVRINAMGALPSFLLDNVVGANPEPEGEKLMLDFTVKAKRLADGTVNGIESCQFEYIMDRPMYAPGVRNPGQHGTPENPLSVSPEQANLTLDAVHMSGAMLGQAEADPTRFYQSLLEPYFPAYKGSFATSSAVPYVPVQVKYEHDYGISSMSDPYYQIEGGQAPSKATQPLSEPATQVFDYQP